MFIVFLTGVLSGARGEGIEAHPRLAAAAVLHHVILNDRKRDQGEQAQGSPSSVLDPFIGDWSENFTFTGAPTQITGTGRFSFVRKGDNVVEGYQTYLVMQTGFGQMTFSNPILFLRGTVDSSAPNGIRWVIFPLNGNQERQPLPNDPQSCDLPNGWPVDLSISSDRHSIDFGYTFADLQPCYPNHQLGGEAAHFTLSSSTHSISTQARPPVATALSTPADDNLIVPGARIGLIYIGEPKSQVVSTLGNPTTTDKGGDFIYDHNPNGKTTVSFKNDKVFSISTTTPRDHTASGIGHGSLIRDVEKAYGSMSCDSQLAAYNLYAALGGTTSWDDKAVMGYDAGITFFHRDCPGDDDEVDEIMVGAPTNAQTTQSSGQTQQAASGGPSQQPSTAPGSLPGDTLIIPGVRIGPVHLGESKSQIESELGTPSRDAADGTMGFRTLDYNYPSGDSLEIELGPDGAVVNVSTSSPRFKTSQGFGHGSRIGDIVQAYGKGECPDLGPGLGETEYYSRGIEFRHMGSNGAAPSCPGYDDRVEFTQIIYPGSSSPPDDFGF